MRCIPALARSHPHTCQHCRDPSLVPLLAEAVRVRESVFGPTHPSLAPALSRLGSAMTESGQVNEATATLSRALSLLKAAVPTTGEPVFASYSCIYPQRLCVVASVISFADVVILGLLIYSLRYPPRTVCPMLLQSPRC